MRDKILIDTNVLVYLIDRREEIKHEKAIETFMAIQNKEDYFVAFQNLKEFSNVARKKTSLSAEEINEFIETFSNSFTLVFDDMVDLQNANFLSEKNNAPFWDSVLVSVMRKEKINKIITENVKDFSKFGEIETINPFDE